MVCRVSANTGRPAGHIVAEAIQVFVRDHSEVLAEHGSYKEAEFYALLADIGEGIAIQGELLQQLTERLTDPSDSLGGNERHQL